MKRMRPSSSDGSGLDAQGPSHLHEFVLVAGLPVWRYAIGDAMLDRFIAGLAMPRSLHAVNVGPEHFDRIARQAMGTPWVPRNPRPIPTPEVLREILELAA